MRKTLFLVIVALLMGCTKEPYEYKPTYRRVVAATYQSWSEIDGVRVDTILTLWDYKSKEYLVAGLKGKDTIWAFDYWRKTELFNGGIRISGSHENYSMSAK